VVGDFTDLAAFTAWPRLTGLVLSTDGTRLVAVRQQPDADGARYVSSLWEVPLDPAGQAGPRRLTRSAKGESQPAFRPDGSLLFVSARPGDAPGGEDDEPALWSLPPTGEPRLVARRAGGLGGPVVAAASGDVVLTGSRLVRSGEDDDAERRETRRTRRITAILHTGMPIRHWDHELGAESERVLLLPADAGDAGDGGDTGDTAAPADLVPEAAHELRQAAYSVSADGATVATSWRPRGRRGASPSAVALVDVATGKLTVLEADGEHEYDAPAISPDGRRVAAGREFPGDFERPVELGLAILPTGPVQGPGESAPAPVVADLGDLNPTAWAWSPDSATLYVAGDLHGRGAVVAVDPATGGVVRRLAADAVYTDLCPSPDGTVLYALRRTVDEPPAPVRLEVGAGDQTPVRLPSPAPAPTLPGELTEVTATAPDGAEVRGWLCLPATASAGDPAPLMLWIHGGPFMSYNSWNWRWNPWVAVARGWAVLLPDPALSTGYGPRWLARAWPYVAADVYADCEAVLERAIERPDVDGTRTACLGGSFGGFMANWVAGHVHRFGAIVTHAGLWALDQQHKTTDAAHFKTHVFGEPAEHPQWYAANSPHNAAREVRTPVLVSHGNRDHRVPVSEALRLWWDLVSGFDGPPEELPHRFLQLVGENHWVLSPANAEIWYDAVLGFCGEHVLGEPWTPTRLL
jgi:dipeptidyl aminopeptidase/acylaminoacyl peptidase